MAAVYVIVSTDKVAIDLKIKEIIGNEQVSIIKYDLEETFVENLIEDLDTYNLFENKKVVIGTNANFLSNNKKNIISHDLKRLEKYISNPSVNNILILVTSNLDKRKKLVTELTKYGKVISDEYSNKAIINNNLESYKMDDKAKNLLIGYCNDNSNLLNELEKLKLYKHDDKIITCNDIKEVCHKNTDSDIFMMIDCIMNNKKEEAYKIYNDLLLKGEVVATMISRLANKLRLIYQVKVFIKDGKTDLDISKLLNMHPYPIKLARELSYKYSDSQLLNYLNSLSELDYNLKSGSKDPNVLFETFIAEI